MNTRCIIVDDEPLAINLIKSYVEKIAGLEVVAECNNAIEAMNVLNAEPVDLIFMDIQMPQITGLELLKSLRQPPAVIITTAYREYALDGFELDVVDYLLKPVSFERFFRAVNKYVNMQQTAATTTPVTAAASTEARFVYVKENKKTHKLSLDQIIYIEGLNEYIGIHTAKGKLVIKQSLTSMEKELPSDTFLRIHKSFLVNMNQISAFSASAIEIGKTELPIGRYYKNVVQKTLNSLSN